MIAGIVTIAAVTALVASVTFLRSLTIVHDRYDLRVYSDSIPAIVIVAIIGSRWDRWRSLAKNWAKINTSLHCSKFAVVHHVVYSLWVG